MVKFEDPPEFDDPPPIPSKAVATAGRRRGRPPGSKNKAPSEKAQSTIRFTGECPRCPTVCATEALLNEHIKTSHYQDVPGGKFEPESPHCKLEHWDTGGYHESSQRANGYDIGRYRLLHHYSRWPTNDEVLRKSVARDRRAGPSIVTIGLDVAWRSIGLAFSESGPGGRTSLCLVPDGGTEQEHVANAANRLRNALIEEWEPLPVLAVMERSFIPPNVKTSGDSSRKLNLIQGTIMDVLWEAMIPVITLSPMTIKKFATGNGHATKDDVFECACEQLGMEPSGDRQKDRKADWDRADALWLAVIGSLLIPEFDFDGTDLFFEDEQLEYLNTVNIEDFEQEDEDDGEA